MLKNNDDETAISASRDFGKWEKRSLFVRISSINDKADEDQGVLL